MIDSVTFRQLEAHAIGGSNPDPNNSSLDDWYCRIRDTSISEFTDEDLSRACRQAIHVDHVVPKAVSRLEDEPLAGEMYDGELLVALRSIPASYWKLNQQFSGRLLTIVEQVKRLSGDEELIHDANELISKIDPTPSP